MVNFRINIYKFIKFTIDLKNDEFCLSKKACKINGFML